MLIVLGLSLVCLLVCIGVHFQAFGMLSPRTQAKRRMSRRRVMFGVVAILAAHMVEIAVFAAAMAFLHQLPSSWEVGDLQGATVGFAPDYLYVSAMAYTTLGFEQITPVGAIRLLIGVEALTGLVLVAWSASFTFLQMARYWIEPPDAG